MNAVSVFQTQHGLKPDGKIGKMTFAKMRQVWKFSSAELSHFLGQTHVESGGFLRLYEDMNYSAKRLIEIFKSDFDLNRDKWLSPKEKDKVNSLIGKPIAIANFVYANQNGNGPESSGDGWKHRGFGTGMITGKENQNNFADWIKDPAIKINPELIATKYAFESFLWYFEKRKIRNYSAFVSNESILNVSRIVNIGNVFSKKTPIGLEERIKWTKYYLTLAA